MKTPQEIATLQADWKRDRSWDIEQTPGFEDHEEELRAYRYKVEADEAARATADRQARLNELAQVGIDALDWADMQEMAKQPGSTVNALFGAFAAMLLPVVERLRDAEAKNAEQADAIEILRDEVHDLRRQNGRA